MNSTELLQILNRGCRGELSAIRAITRLQPSGGAGDKVFPPTYEKGQYAREQRIIDGKTVETVLLDSVQSQANRFEEALLEAYRGKRFSMPVFEMTVGEHEVTSLTAPHRVHDAILRDSIWGGMPFRDSENGKRLISARAWNAAAFFEYAPTVLLFGTWDSQGGGGVNTAKVARSLVSEIIALDTVRGVRTSSRIDPLGIKALQGLIVKKENGEWSFAETGEKKPADKKAKSVKPSEINHGNIPPTITDPVTGPGGVTFREAVQTTVLSFTQLRRLKFPSGDSSSTDRDVSGRAVIAALGLLAVTLQQEEGYQLRSRCQLIPIEAPQFEVIGRTEQEREKFGLDSSTVENALSDALTASAKHGLRWHDGPLELQPRPDLLKLVQYSDKAMAAGPGE
jgi:CRISPR-associated protein Csb1